MLIYNYKIRYLHLLPLGSQPANILMDAQGHVKLSDFGTACKGTYEGKGPEGGHDHMMAGTLYYMPPECMRSGAYSHKVRTLLVHLCSTQGIRSIGINRSFRVTSGAWA